MNNIRKAPELLSPAGNFDKMKAAILYGANAVYLAGDDFGMRAAADNFTFDELREAVNYAHERNVRVNLTLNTMPHTDEYPKLTEFVKSISGFGIDAIIAADLGVMALVREYMPGTEIHVSTQQSTVSAAACREWYRLGAKRVVLARELTLNEIREIRKNVPDDRNASFNLRYERRILSISARVSTTFSLIKLPSIQFFPFFFCFSNFDL